jgi:hypothetical protein
MHDVSVQIHLSECDGPERLFKTNYFNEVNETLHNMISGITIALFYNRVRLQHVDPEGKEMSVEAVKMKHEEQLMRLPNVAGVGIGEKAGRAVIKVFVTHKVPVSALQPQEIVPKVAGRI